MSLKASIDIGTNSTRLLIVECSLDKTLTPVEHFEHLTKLGAGLDMEQNLSRDAMQRVIDVLSAFRGIIDNSKIRDVRLFATSATREAHNQDDFVSHIKKQTGLDCRILSGKEEARLSFLGAISDMQTKGCFLLCDVGGGSSELIYAHEKEILSSQSLKMGSGRLQRDFLHCDPPTEKEINQATKFIASQLQDFHFEPQRIIAVGGTAVALALMDAEIPFSKPGAAHHYQLTKNSLQALTKKLLKQTLTNRKELIGLNPQRADVILGGALIYAGILKTLGVDSMTTSLRDLLFGIFLE